MPSTQMKKIYSRVSPKLARKPEFVSLCETLEDEVISDYQFSLRKAVVDYILIDPDEKKRLKIDATPLTSPRRSVF